MMVSSECKRQEPTEHGSRQTLTRAGGGQITKLESSLSHSLTFYLLPTLLTPLFSCLCKFKNPFFYTFFSFLSKFPLLVLEADQMMKCNLFKVTPRGKKNISEKLLSDRVA